MVTYIILREDDVNATTKPEYIERVYEPLIKRGIPINVAVIPSVYCANKLPEGHPLLTRQKYYAYIQESEGENKYLNINEAKRLVSFLNRENFEILQHGYSHERIHDCYEFGITDSKELESRVLEGKHILEDSFGKVPRFFVAPHEYFSKEGFKVITKNFTGTFIYHTSKLSFLRTLPADFYLPYLSQKTMGRDFYFFKDKFMALDTHGFYLLPHSKGIDVLKFAQRLIQRLKIVVIVNHYWQYSSDNDLIKSWFDLLEFLIKGNCRFISCSGLYEKLCP
jgi:hypothetical protein